MNENLSSNITAATPVAASSPHQQNNHLHSNLVPQTLSSTTSAAPPTTTGMDSLDSLLFGLDAHWQQGSVADAAPPTSPWSTAVPLSNSSARSSNLSSGNGSHLLSSPPQTTSTSDLGVEMVEYVLGSSPVHERSALSSSESHGAPDSSHLAVVIEQMSKLG